MPSPVPSPVTPAVTTYVTAAFCLLDGTRLVTVRKAGTNRFQLPGGKIDPGENAREAAVREVREEVGVVLDADGEWLGRFHDVAANEPGAFVDATVFVRPLPAGARPAPLAEIAEVRWLEVGDPAASLPADLAPLLANHVLPALRERLKSHGPDAGA